MIYFILVIAGILWGLMDSAQFHNSPSWMNPSNTWKSKYIDNTYPNPFKLYGLAEFIPMDYWHLAKLMLIVLIAVAITLKYKEITGNRLLDVAIMLFIIQCSFQITFWLL